MASKIEVDEIFNAGGDNDTGIDLATNDQILLKVANATKLTMNSTGQTTIVGEGGTTTTSLQQGLAKMWANVDGTGTAAIDDSLNTSGFTDNGTGDYSVEIANDFATSNHSTQLNGNSAHVGITSIATGSVRVFVTDSSNSSQDVDPTTFASFGDLA